MVKPSDIYHQEEYSSWDRHDRDVIIVHAWSLVWELYPQINKWLVNSETIIWIHMARITDYIINDKTSNNTFLLVAFTSAAMMVVVWSWWIQPMPQLRGKGPPVWCNSGRLWAMKLLLCKPLSFGLRLKLSMWCFGHLNLGLISDPVKNHT